MKTYIALLRGINVGGHNILPMQALREALSAAGFGAVKTYIQSGNLILHSDKSSRVLSKGIADTIEAEFGFRPETLVIDTSALEQALSNNPFDSADPKQLILHFLQQTPPAEAVATAQAQASNDEQLLVVGNIAYLHAPQGISRSKLAANIAKLLSVNLTTRNLNTASKLLALAAGSE